MFQCVSCLYKPINRYQKQLQQKEFFCVIAVILWIFTYDITIKLESPLVKGIVTRGQSAFHIHITGDNVIDNFSLT